MTNITFSIHTPNTPFQSIYSVFNCWKGIIVSAFFQFVPIALPMPFHALPNPNMIWQSIEGHALPNTSTYRNVWKGMPFYACFAISYWGLEEHGRASIYERAFCQGRACPSKQNIMFGRACPSKRYNILFCCERAILNNNSVSITLCAEHVWPSSETKVTSCKSWAFPALPSIFVMHIT